MVPENLLPVRIDDNLHFVPNHIRLDILRLVEPYAEFQRPVTSEEYAEITEEAKTIEAAEEAMAVEAIAKPKGKKK